MKSRFIDLIQSTRTCSKGTRGCWARFERPSDEELGKLVLALSDESADLILSGLEVEDLSTGGTLALRKTALGFSLSPSRSDPTRFLPDLYRGNWCLFSGTDGTKSLPKFEFRFLEEKIEDVFESVGAAGGLIAFHDNGIVWAYAYRAEDVIPGEPMVSPEPKTSVRAEDVGP